MESLYVCLFSNGHIKVGRSIEPASRIAAHADRVACMGVELSDSFAVVCSGPAAPRETRLISQCAESAESRYQNEWFAGLDFVKACEWARDAATAELEVALYEADSFGARLRVARLGAGLTQGELGRGMGFKGADLNKAAISTWEVGRNFPNVIQLRTLCKRLGVTADSLLFSEQERQALQGGVCDLNPAVVSSSSRNASLSPASTSGAFFSQGA